MTQKKWGDVENALERASDDADEALRHLMEGEVEITALSMVESD